MKYTQPASQRRRRKKIAATIVAVTAVAGIGIAGTFAEGSDFFSSTTTNEGNHFATGDVLITDDDHGTALFDLPAMTPSTVVERCINVVNQGTMAFDDVILTADVSGDLAPHVGLTVASGTGAAGGEDHDCANFEQERDVLTGTLQQWERGVLEPGMGVGATRSYKFTAELVDPGEAQGKSATVAFSFTGRAR
jgi:hypothetical protein